VSDNTYCVAVAISGTGNGKKVEFTEMKNPSLEATVHNTPRVTAGHHCQSTTFFDKIQLKVYNAIAPTTGSCWSGWTWADSTSIWELHKHALWKESTKLKYSALYYEHQPSGLTEVSGTSATPSIKITASYLKMANKDSCTKLCTRKFSDWQPSHTPLNLKGVDNRVKPVTVNTFASGTTASTPCLLAATFHFANHFQCTVRQDLPCLEHGGGDIMLTQEPSLGHYTTGMVGNTSQLLRENHSKHTTKDCKVWITLRGKELPMVTKNLNTTVFPRSTLLAPKTRLLTL
jgi:hypothetical protein